MALIYEIGTGFEKVTVHQLVDEPEFWDFENATGCLDAPNIIAGGSTGEVGWRYEPCLRDAECKKHCLHFPVTST